MNVMNRTLINRQFEEVVLPLVEQIHLILAIITLSTTVLIRSLLNQQSLTVRRPNNLNLTCIRNHLAEDGLLEIKYLDESFLLINIQMALVSLCE